MCDDEKTALNPSNGMTAEYAFGIVNECLIRGKIIPEAEAYPFWEAVRNALEKQTPKPIEPQERTNRYGEEVTEWFCPTCGCVVDKDEDVYCSYCGQRLEGCDEDN